MPDVLIPNATLIETFTDTRFLVTDDGATLPETLDSSGTNVGTQSAVGTCTLDTNNYYYYVVSFYFAKPEYGNVTPAKAMFDHQIYTQNYEILPPYVCPVFQSNSNIMTPTLANSVVAGSGSFVRSIYWTSASAATSVNNTSYGVLCQLKSPTISGSYANNNEVLTVYRPNIRFRTHNTYFSSTFYAALTDVKYKYIFKIYRAPKNSSISESGWQLNQRLQTLISVNSI